MFVFLVKNRAISIKIMIERLIDSATVPIVSRFLNIFLFLIIENADMHLISGPQCLIWLFSLLNLLKMSSRPL